MEEQTQKTIDMASQWFNWQRDLWENWMKTTVTGTQAAQSVWQERTASDILTALQQTWFKSFLKPSLGKEPLEGLGATISKRWQDASTAYTNLLAFWAKSTTLLAQLTPGTVPTTEKLKEIHDQWVKEYQTIMGSLWGAYPSKDTEEAAKAYQSATAASAESGWHFMEPLLKNLEQLPEILTKMTTGDAAAGVEMIELLRKNYEATLGKALLAPPIGYSREFVERVNQTLDAYIHYNMALAQYFAPFYQSAIRAAEKVFQRLTESKSQEVTPEAFREFYRIWWTTNEEVYSEMLGSEQFTKLLGEVLRQGLLFKKQTDDLSDQILKFTNIPTKQEMDELYRTIHDLRSEVRQQRRAIRELEQRLGIKATRPSPIAE
ncbi:MAG: poly(R)-hydroxyalkanoic acid synthase subunit PhaE [Chloroflexota bacterium]